MTASFPIACCSIALRDLPILEAAGQIADAGFHGIEIWYPHVERMDTTELREVAAACASLGLSIIVISPYFSFTSGRERWNQSVELAKGVLHAANCLKVNKIRTFIDCGPGLGSETAKGEHWVAAREGLEKLCSLDPEKIFLVETHEKTLANTLPSVRRILREVDRPNLRLNLQATRDFLSRGFLSCLEELYPWVDHMHWEQIRPDHSPTYIEEEGLIDFESIIEFLQAMDYRGTASVEYCWTPVEEGRIASAARYLQGLLHKMEQTA
jgi:3-dehydroshikimate dehydratase